AIYALMNAPPQVVPCVDVAVYRVQHHKELSIQVQILLGRKLSETGWRLPGGHVDVTDPDYLTAARRELFEETGMTCETAPTMVHWSLLCGNTSKEQHEPSSPDRFLQGHPHWRQYPQGTTRVHSYFESRGGEFAETVFFGLQYYLHNYLGHPVAQHDIEEAD